MGIDGFIHIGQISEDRVERIRDLFKVGDNVAARVIKIEGANQRIALSIKALEYDPSELQREISAWKNNSSQSEFGTIGDLFAREDMDG
jgi:small subunit ribosomal protein S1